MAIGLDVGIDFDGIISDIGYTKSIVAKILYGVEIAPELCSTPLVDELLTPTQHNTVRNIAYDSKNIIEHMRFVDGSVDNIRKLLADGHNLEIITTRYTDVSVINAYRLLECEDLHKIPIINLKKGEHKDEVCKGKDVFFDDQFRYLEKLLGVVPHLFLLNWKYNAHVEVPASINRVANWDEFYSCVNKIESSKLSSLVGKPLIASTHNES